MHMIRLAIIRQRYRSDGGAERFITHMIKALNNINNLQINLITRKWTKDNKFNYNLYLCNPKIWGRVSRERQFSCAVQKCCQYENFDLIQSHERMIGCHIFRAGDGIHKAWLKRRTRIISIYHKYLTQISSYHRYILNIEHAMFNSASLKKIICNSKMIRSEIMYYYGIPKEKISLIYNAVDLNYFVPANPHQRFISRKTLSIPQKACVLIYVGSGFKRKGLYQAIYAIFSTNRYLIIVGQDKYLLYYKALSKSLGCFSRVRFLGVRKDILSLYHAADALILPTVYDPFPNVILEAMSCGLPVITSYSCGGAEFIDNGKEGFVCDALDITKLKEFVNIIPLIELNSNMSIASRNRVKNCSFDKISNALNILYQQILS